MSKVEESQDGVSETTFTALSNHLPHSVALFRRLQFMNIKGGKTPNSHVLTLFKSSEVFTVAYLDFSRGTETEMWLYSSTERLRGNEIEAECREQVLEILKRVRKLESDYIEANGVRPTPGIVLIGSLHEKLLKFLESQQRVQQATGPHFKFIFEAGDLPPDIELHNEDLVYSEIRRSDIPLVLSRTAIPRKERTMLLLPSVAVTVNKVPAAWGFLGPDASLTSLHVEENYRGQGLAKAIARNLFTGKSSAFGPEPIYHADVGTNNLQSQGVCKSLGGNADFCVYWVWIKL